MGLAPEANSVVSLFRLDGAIAFLSGATGLLGKPMARALCAAGAHVILNSRSKQKLNEFAAELSAAGHSASVSCFDVSDERSREDAVAQIARDHGHLDVLINNASSGRPGTIAQSTVADFEQGYSVNVVAAFALVQRSMSLLQAAATSRRGGASVINIGSMYAKVSPDPRIYGTSGANNPPYYGAAKAGLLQLTRYMACHFAQDGIRVNCISPGPFPDRRYLESDPDFESRLTNKTPMHRTGIPEEICGPLLFLASPASSYVTGIDLAVDGGWTAW